VSDPIIQCSLNPEPRAVADARAAMEALRGRLSPDAFNDLRLMVSELVTNSLRHAELQPADRITLTARSDDSVVRIEVRNRGRGFTVPPRDGSVSIGGWGLVIVAELAMAWGVLDDGSTCVWFELLLESARSDA